MLHRASLWSSLCVLRTTSLSNTLEQRGGSVGSSWEVSSVVQSPSCGGVPGGLQSADQGSLLLQSQVRKPQDAANAISEEMLRELIGPHQPPVQLLSDSPHVSFLNLSATLNETGSQESSQLLHVLQTGSSTAATLSRTRIFSGVTSDGELAQVDSTVHHRQAMNFSLDSDPKEEVLVQTQQRMRFNPVLDSTKDDKTAWTRSKQLVELVQTTLLLRSQSLAEGVMLFLLCNIFLCAIVSGMCFIWSGRNADSDDHVDLLPGEKVAKKRDNHTFNGMGALEERRSHALVQKQAPSARSNAKETPRAPASSTPSGPSRQLCPELVVPLGSECVLAVRCLITAKTQQCNFEVLDINGKGVLRVEVSPQSALSRNSHVPSQRSPTITLKALQPRETTGGLVLAYCCNVSRADDLWTSNGKRNVCIYNENDELFAHIVKDEARHRYVLTSGRPGLQLLFEGNFEERAVDVANEARELLAATEPAAMPFDPINRYYKLRVAADVDVGLVLCGLLAIDQIEIK